MKIRLHLPIVFLLLLHFSLSAQSHVDPKSIKGKMQWFADAKLGIFIHTGIYSVNGVDESWSFYNRKISHSDYMKQLKGFEMKQYDPEAWADLVKESGARYAVITTKHHDGVAMYPTKVGSLSSVNSTPARKDIVGPFLTALRKRGLKAGTYFSLIDWTHPDYPEFIKDSVKYKLYTDYARWNRFRTFMQSQIAEISSMYNPDLFWFDGDWEHSAEQWEAEKIRHMILERNPAAIINGRLQGYGDYVTPEQNVPVSKPSYSWWELCMTTNNNWGYQPSDTNWKTPYEVITIFVDAVSHGGNLLLNMGPKSDGTIPTEQKNVLKELGAWNRRNGEAVFGTIAGISPGHFYGPTTLSKDSTILYLFLPGRTSGQVVIKGLDNHIEDITMLGSPAKLTHKVVGKISWSHVPGLVYIDIPSEGQDPYVTVLRVKLDKRIRLYRGEGGFE
ncbi:MAG: alpha-L-fucosidase [Bacteroidetes bacterium]|nr:alpha-L-fucosidase [Bacteroidota bacterium]